MTIPVPISWALSEAEVLWVGLLEQAVGGPLTAQSACTLWSNAELIDHVIGGGERYAMLLQGASAAEVAATRGKDYLGGNVIETFWQHENDMRRIAERIDLSVDVDHRAGRRSGESLLNMRVMELSLHAHDLALGIGTPWLPSPVLQDHLLAEIGPIIADLRDLGMFAPAAEPASDAAPDRILAMSGRGATP